MFFNRVTRLFNIEYPIVQAGMVWTSGWRLASAVSNAGGLGIIGAGSMNSQLLEEHIRKCKAATNKPFGVNLPLLYSGVEKQIDIIIRNKVQIVVTSAGNPATFTPLLKQHGIKVVHVVSSSRFAKKAEAAGCDAVIAEGFEAGGHNGREETTTLVLLPLVCTSVEIPVIAAGGIATGRQMLACMVLGAEGVQMGSRFVASEEASSHPDFKNAVINSNEGDTIVTLKELTPVRLIKNDFYMQLAQAQKNCATAIELQQLLGKGRAKKGIFEGDLEKGELEIGQVSAILKDIKPVKEIIAGTWLEFNEALQKPLK
ncbi:nitronate monooxygenase [Ginsengibacter hankyongi]|uniref:Nitronate monooxygenase n=1 Tax=Ginsengibacter hankyongi TaxID=2607284 RepID=A0A5J5IK57_9BACT|nr:nitronate monooxygenase [Ginsengibacter hankyongi]KAA9041400.1 nitronate monooxygenase [Ginsengibacter hankyongi]